MPGPVADMFFYLCLIVDIFNREIAGWEVHERESTDLAAVQVWQAVLAEGYFCNRPYFPSKGFAKKSDAQA